MKYSPLRTAVSLAFGTALMGTISAGAQAASDSSPFAMTPLSSGYMVADNMEGSCGGKKGMEGKCGGKKNMEGKCGGKKGMEGKCGGKKNMEGKCGAGMSHMRQMPSSIDCNYDEDLCG